MGGRGVNRRGRHHAALSNLALSHPLRVGGGVNLFFVVTYPPASREQPPADGQITTKKNPEEDTGMKAM